MGYLEITYQNKKYKISEDILDMYKNDHITLMDLVLSSIPEYKRYHKWEVEMNEPYYS